MKKIQAMLLMLLVVVMGMSVHSCTKQETKIGIEVPDIYVRKDPSYTLKYLDKYYVEYLAPATIKELSQSEIDTLFAFNIAVVAADEELTNSYHPTDSLVMNIYNTKLAPYKSGKGFEGYILITKNSSELGKITFTK